MHASSHSLSRTQSAFRRSYKKRDMVMLGDVRITRDLPSLTFGMRVTKETWCT